MEKIIVNGPGRLSGTVEINGMKNSALGILFGCILVEGPCIIENLPGIKDVTLCLDILAAMGASITRLNDTSIEIDTQNVRGGTSPDELVRKMRASYYLVGAELGRFGCARVGLPGGCDFGVRPIDQHIKAFQALGTVVDTSGDEIVCRAPNGLHGANMFFDVVTVGGTMNLMLAAVLAEGTTVIENAAREPHIVDLANFLGSCGAEISGAGTDTIKIKGVSRLHGCTYAIAPDMIEAGTYMIVAAATGGELRINNVIPKHLESITSKLEEMGVQIEELDDALIVRREQPLKPIKLKTRPYPGFPTDMQPQIAVLLCMAGGKSEIIEGVYENRFRYTEELRRMGADIAVDGNVATINGPTEFHQARVRAVDLRAGAAMIIAALAACGRTEIEDIYHIERGYDDIVGKLSAVGADIRRVVIPDVD